MFNKLFNKFKRKLKRIINLITKIKLRFMKSLLKGPNHYEKGSIKWLQSTEIYFGGYHSNIERRKVSKLDPRSKKELSTGGMIGGDKMLEHSYAHIYSKYLKKFSFNDELLIVEFGILKGTGLATFSKLFPNSYILGLDIDLNHFNSNRAYLESKGAFEQGKLELGICDQFTINENQLSSILGSKKIDICIDDGFHSLETIGNTAKAIKPFLNKKHCVFFEDNDKSFSTVNEILGDISNVKSYKEICVASCFL